MSRRKASARLSLEEHAAVREARRLGLYVLFEGPPAARTWRVSSAATGRVVGFWEPRSGRLHCGQQRQVVGDWRQALRVMAAGG